MAVLVNHHVEQHVTLAQVAVFTLLRHVIYRTKLHKQRRELKRSILLEELRILVPPRYREEQRVMLGTTVQCRVTDHSEYLISCHNSKIFNT